MGTSDGSKPGNASRVPVSSRPNVASCTRSSCSVPYENRRGIDPIHTLSRSLYSPFRRCREPRTAPAVSHGPHGSHGLKNLFCSPYSAPPWVDRCREPRTAPAVSHGPHGSHGLKNLFCSPYSASMGRSLPRATDGTDHADSKTFSAPRTPRL